PRIDDLCWTCDAVFVGVSVSCDDQSSQHNDPTENHLKNNIRTTLQDTPLNAPMLDKSTQDHEQVIRRQRTVDCQRHCDVFVLRSCDTQQRTTGHDDPLAQCALTALESTTPNASVQLSY